MRKKLIAGNWKMHHTVSTSRKFLDAFLPALQGLPKADILLAPSFTVLFQMGQSLNGCSVMLGAQNLYYEEKGAFTGEVSVEMLKDCGCQAVILGHSERRHVFNENDDLINKKVSAGINGGLKVIFCVGETGTQREEGKTGEVIDRQLKLGLKGLGQEQLANLIIAYEPVWAIGTNVNATPEQAEEVHKDIRQWIVSRFGEEEGKTIRILYGGSVKPSNASDLLSRPDIDGLLVGSASLDPESFCAIIQSVE